jgi:hypothetical protein
LSRFLPVEQDGPIKIYTPSGQAMRAPLVEIARSYLTQPRRKSLPSRRHAKALGLTLRARNPVNLLGSQVTIHPHIGAQELDEMGDFVTRFAIKGYGPDLNGAHIGAVFLRYSRCLGVDDDKQISRHFVVHTFSLVDPFAKESGGR